MINTIFNEQTLPQPLSHTELEKYFKEMSLGNTKIREKIILHNIRLVFDEIKSNFKYTPYDINDLISIGLIGLIKSVDGYDVTKNVKFSTYSKQAIYNNIINYIKKISKSKNDYSLYEQTKFKKKTSSEELQIIDILPDKNTDFISDYEKDLSYTIIRQLLSELPERDKEIMYRYFGFNNYPKMTQKEIGNLFGITQEGVRKIIKRNLDKISNHLQKLDIIELHQKPSKKKIKK